MTAPTIHKITKRGSIAGEYALIVSVQYDDQDAPDTVTFKGSVYGGPILMITKGIPGGVFVSQRVTDNIGTKLDTRWVRRFFKIEE